MNNTPPSQPHIYRITPWVCKDPGDDLLLVSGKYPIASIQGFLATLIHPGDVMTEINIRGTHLTYTVDFILNGQPHTLTLTRGND